MKNEELLNEKVIHKTYRKGFIKAVDGYYIEVEFESGKISQFVVPTCFDRFIKLADEEKNEQVQRMLAYWKEINEIDKKEQLQKQTQETQNAIVMRDKEREIKKIEAARKEAERSRIFVQMRGQVKEENQ